jgi:lipoprotein signal peptidase
MTKNRALFITIAILILDRAAKMAAQYGLTDPGALVNRTGNVFWGFAYYLHTGFLYNVECSFLPVVLGLAVVAWMASLAYKPFWDLPSPAAARLGFGLALVGALSQFVDCALYGGAIDYILLTYMFDGPVFNLADLAIAAGGLIIAGSILRNELKRGGYHEPELASV